MNDFENHEPSAEFRARLKQDISRTVRSEERFGASSSPMDTRRLTLVVGIAAGTVLTLVTGMVLGASVSYASAAIVDAPRPALAIRPIGNAINALRCTPDPEEKAPPAKKVAITPVLAGTTEAVPAEAIVAPAPTPAKPDRARIAALAKEHQTAVVRGDTAAEYVVMVLDAAEKYAWSTHGNGGVSIEVGGDSRTLRERREYQRLHRVELGGPVSSYWYAFSRPGDSVYSIVLDSARSRVVYRGVGGARGRGGDTTRGDSGFFTFRDKMSTDYMSLRFKRDSLRPIRYDSSAASRRGFLVRGRGSDSVGDLYYSGYISLHANAGGRGRGDVAMDSASANRVGVYVDGWSGTRQGALVNQAPGLQDPRPGESGIQGLMSVSVASTDIYHFAAGELAPRALKVMVVNLRPGTVWKGR